MECSAIFPDQIQGVLDFELTQYGVTSDFLTFMVAFEDEVWMELIGGGMVPPEEDHPMRILFDDVTQASSIVAEQGILDASALEPSLRLAGEEDVDGMASWRLEGTLDASLLIALLPEAESGHEVDVAVWVSQDDHLIRRVEVQGAMNATESDELGRDLRFSRFSKEVIIERPSEMEYLLGHAVWAYTEATSFRFEIDYIDATRPYGGLGQQVEVERVEARVIIPTGQVQGTVTGTSDGAQASVDIIAIGDDI